MANPLGVHLVNNHQISEECALFAQKVTLKCYWKLGKGIFQSIHIPF